STAEGKFEIPEELVVAFRDKYPNVRFLGQTLRGLNQVVIEALCLSDKEGKVNWSLAEENQPITAFIAHTALNGEFNTIARRVNAATPEGKLVRNAVTW